MKVPVSVRNIYFDQIEKYEQLKELVDNRMLALKRKGWHYESRVKELESFTLKLESGRVPDPFGLEDFLACTLVVQNKAVLALAEEIILRDFELQERRPPLDAETHKSADSFPFDDLRLYVRWRDSPTVRPAGFDGILFEIQLKTFLEHAWAIATHDLVYKSDSVSWSKDRIAYQIKAMLEHSECSILAAEELAQTEVLKKSDRKTNRLASVIGIINRYWAQHALPDDRVRLAKNVSSLLAAAKIEIEDFDKILLEETESGRGAKTLNLSPYGAIVQSLIYLAEEQILDLLHKTKSRSWCLPLTPEIELPQGLSFASIKNATLIGSWEKVSE